MEANITVNEKTEKLKDNFERLSEPEKAYIIGIIEAMMYAGKCRKEKNAEKNNNNDDSNVPP